MKRFLFLAALLPLFIQAQTVSKGESTLVYSLPKTELVIHITSEIITEKPGQFYQYSERYLATSDIITGEKTYHRLTGVQVETTHAPDPKRTFTIAPGKNALAGNITVNNEGILCGINVEPMQMPSRYETVSTTTALPDKERKLLPLSEEYMMAGSVAKMAEGAAKDIYRLRENRADILAGDVDYVPTDGQSLKAMLEEIDAQEKALTELFTGTVSRRTVTKTIRYTPEKAGRDMVIFRFSPYLGVVDSDELSGEPFYLNLSYKAVREVIDPKVKEKKNEIKVFSVIPVTAQLTISSDKIKLFDESVILPQLGILTPVPFHTMDKYSRVYVSPETGRLLSVEQNRKK